MTARTRRLQLLKQRRSSRNMGNTITDSGLSGDQEVSVKVNDRGMDKLSVKGANVENATDDLVGGLGPGIQHTTDNLR